MDADPYDKLLKLAYERNCNGGLRGIDTNLST